MWTRVKNCQDAEGSERYHLEGGGGGLENSTLTARNAFGIPKLSEQDEEEEEKEA